MARDAMKPQPVSHVLLVVVAIVAQYSLFAEVLDKTKSIAGTAVRYKVVLPNHYDPEKPYPRRARISWGLTDDRHRREHAAKELAR
jgi:hypothetical protein